MKEGTPEEGKRWIVLGEKLYDVTKDEQMKKIIKFCLDFYKKQN